MNTDYYSNITFGAKFNSIAKVRMIKPTGKSYKKADVSFVKFDKTNERDMFVLSECAKNWNDDEFAKSVYLSAQSIASDCESRITSEIYMLTTQDKDFDKLKAENILGLADVTLLGSDKRILLEHLKVNPFIKNDKSAQIKGVGTALLDSLKSMYTRIILISIDKDSVKDFYRRNSFIEYPEGTNLFTWFSELKIF